MAGCNGDWRDQCPSLISRLSWMMKAGHHTDVHFLVGSGSPKHYSAHKLILASGSPEFESMFFEQFPELEHPIKFPDVDPLGFRFMLRYLYEDHTTFSTDKEVFSTFHVAEKFKIDKLRELCSFQILKMKPSLENLWTVLEFSHHFPLGDLPRLSVEFLIENARKVFQVDDFLSAPEQLIKFMLQLPLLRVSEIEVLKFVTHWAENSAKWNLQNVQEVIRPLLSHIHFPSIARDDFRKFTKEKHGLLDVEDQSAIMSHLINPMVHRLPGWCCLDGPRYGLLEMLPMQLVDNVQKQAFTSAVTSFEIKYEITLKNPVYQDVLNMTFIWCSRQEDLPLVCDVAIQSGKSVFSKKGIEKLLPLAGISIDFDCTFLHSTRQAFTVRVDLKRAAKIAFLQPSTLPQLPIQCRLLGASGVIQRKQKVVFSKAYTVSDITMIRRTAQKNTNVQSNKKKLAADTGGARRSVASGLISPRVAKYDKSNDRQTETKTKKIRSLQRK